MTALRYPAPPTSDQVDDYHGTRIADPYRPLEDPDAPASRAWLAAQNVLTESILAQAPARAEIVRRLAEVWDVPRAGAPWRRGRRWFQLRNSGLQDQDVLWVADGPDDEGRVAFDPNAASDHGIVAINAVEASEDGWLAAIALSEAGSDWQTWTVHDLESGEVLPDRIPWAKFTSAGWAHDGSGFFYGRYPAPPDDAAFEAPNRNMELRFHRLGTDPATDPIVFATPDEPEWGFEPEVSEDGRTLVISTWRGTDPENRIHVADLSGGVQAAVVRPLLDRADAAYVPIAVVDRTLYLRTDLDAPLGRVIAVDVDDAANVREVIPETDGALQAVRLAGGRFVADYLHDAHHRLVIFELDGRPGPTVELPWIGSVQELNGRPADAEVFATFASFVAPPVVLGIRVADGRVRQVGSRTLPWDPTTLVTEQVFVTSDDGTRVPLFLTHRRDIVPAGDVPTLLYGYGGFQIAIGPMFKPEWLTWVERGGLLAVASLRGGSEYGKTWHDAGRLSNKQRVFDDFAACARWLAASGWTTAARIGINGASNGGLLVGASITQHPELFGAAVGEVGVMDMLRFDRFTIGWGWTSDYGSASDAEQFRTLLRYSPLHNCASRVYPPTLLTTGDHDDRVVPGHTLKFAATLQAAQEGDAPILLRVDTDAGHGAGKPVGKKIEERADVLAFLDMTIGRRA